MDAQEIRKSDLTGTHRVGPFMVVKQEKSKVFYENSRINRVMAVHISACHPYLGRMTPEQELAAARESDGMFEVEAILAHKFKSPTSRTILLQVKWTGYALPTWEPLANNMSLRKNVEFIKYAQAIPELEDFIPKNISI